MCRLSWNLGASTSWNPHGLSRPGMGLLHLYLIETVIVLRTGETRLNSWQIFLFTSMLTHDLGIIQHPIKQVQGLFIKVWIQPLTTKVVSTLRFFCKILYSCFVSYLSHTLPISTFLYLITLKMWHKKYKVEDIVLHNILHSLITAPLQFLNIPLTIFCLFLPVSYRKVTVTNPLYCLP